MEARYSTVLIDDEQNARQALRIVIEEFAPQLEIVGIGESAKEGRDLILEKKPQVVFLDIQMPHLTGMELIESIEPENRTFDLVFLTAHNSFAHEAFKLNAFDYLLKPIHIPDLLSVIKKIEAKHQESQDKLNLDRLRQSFHDRIAIPTSEGTEFITISDIIRIEADGSYVTIFLINQKQRVFAKNLKALEHMLVNHSFFRTHKSHLINVNHIQRYTPYKDGGSITMVDGSNSILSRRQKEAFVSLFQK